jgi:Restriction endonuclease BglII
MPQRRPQSQCAPCCVRHEFPTYCLYIQITVTLDSLPSFIRQHYEVHEWKHASAILVQDFADEWIDICEVLTAFRLRRSWVNVGGGRKSKVSEAIDTALCARGWEEKQFKTEILVDGARSESPTHQIDCFKNRVALEIEWNNKDPFFDRDLNNFRLLFDLRAVSVGVIVTRCDELQDIFAALGRGASYGSSTTHISKLLPRIDGGGGGCPILVLGIRKELYVED